MIIACDFINFVMSFEVLIETFAKIMENNPQNNLQVKNNPNVYGLIISYIPSHVI